MEDSYFFKVVQEKCFLIARRSWWIPCSTSEMWAVSLDGYTVLFGVVEG
jgi:hypothetical protein